MKMVEIPVLKKMLGEDPLNVQELQQLGDWVFALHGLITALIVAPNNKLDIPRPGIKISDADWDKMEEDAIDQLKKESYHSNIVPLFPERLNCSSPLPDYCSLLSRLYHQIHLALAMDTFFTPLVDVVSPPLEAFWENQLSEPQLCHLQKWCDGYLTGIDMKNWPRLTKDQQESIEHLLYPVYTLSSTKPAYTKKSRLTAMNALFSKIAAETNSTMIATMISVLPLMIIKQYDFWRVLEPKGSMKQRRTFRKIPKNKPGLYNPFDKKRYRDCCFQSRQKRTTEQK